ncbi:MAG: hypothetical protein KDA60_19335 [Planctomycetales bacterium]|nr:hypothetical protein [Planctomycetales bacterium]
MAFDPQQSPFFTHIDVSPQTSSSAKGSKAPNTNEIAPLLQHLIAQQQRQNELLEELVKQSSAAQRQRASELNQWKEANPHLARRCRQAAEALSSVQTEFLTSLTEEISDNAEGMMEGDFLLNEFVDRFGPRLAHLNGVLQVLSQLSAPPASNQGS